MVNIAKKTLLLSMILGLYVSSTTTINAEDSQETSISASIARGSQTFDFVCHTCHQARPASDFTAGEWSLIIHHMRLKGRLTGGEARDVENFLISTVTPDYGNQKEENNVSAESLISKFACKACHSINGEGGETGGNLNNVYDNKGRVFIINKLSNPQFNNPNSVMPHIPYSEKEKNLLADYLKTLR